MYKFRVSKLSKVERVFVFENGGRTEISHEEFLDRERVDPLDRFFIFVHNCLLEVTEEGYKGWYEMEDHINYTDKRSVKREASLENCVENGFIQLKFGSNSRSVEATVEVKLLVSEMWAVIETLSEDEKELIRAFYNNVSQSEIAERLNCSQATVSRKMQALFAKIRSEMGG